jgi:hypothetical protein
MYAIAIHSISDPEKFWAGAAELQVPAGTTLHSVLPNKEGTRAVCVWEADSLDTVRDFVDPATQGISDNEYFEANKQNAVGLPGSTVAAAR